MAGLVGIKLITEIKLIKPTANQQLDRPLFKKNSFPVIKYMFKYLFKFI